MLFGLFLEDNRLGWGKQNKNTSLLVHSSDGLFRQRKGCLNAAQSLPKYAKYVDFVHYNNNND